MCVVINDNESNFDISITSPTNILGVEGQRLAETFSKAISAIIKTPETKLNGLDLLNDRQKQEVWAWNQNIPHPVSRCVHALFEEKAAKQPRRQAIQAWDGNLTFEELDGLANKVAAQLILAGILPRANIPICFEKSMWAVVAMLGIMKAGCAFIPLDPLQAPDRRERVLQQLGSTVIVTSERFARESLLSNVGRDIITVGPSSPTLSQNMKSTLVLPTPDPEALMYLLFTSGSTGQPKGVMLSHRAVSSSCTYHGERLGFSDKTRTLQFASFTFDPSILEIFTTLIFGGCVCMLPDDDRLGTNQDGEALKNMDITLMAITTSVARLLEPHSVPRLTTLLISGEVSRPTDFQKWSHVPNLFHGYGPTECAILCVMGQIDFDLENFRCIGTATGCNTWVVDPKDLGTLSPVGSVGELVIEGPILANGYFNNDKQTAEAFFKNPPWLLAGGPGYSGRQGTLYKTGDLVRYGQDNNLIFVGRKDNQVKINGQRVELSEIEHHLQACLPHNPQVVVEIVRSYGDVERSELVGFVIPPTSRSDETSIDFTPNPTLISTAPRPRLLPVGVDTELSSRLPGYMIPTVLMEVEFLPLSTSGKVDRAKLRKLGSMVTTADLAALRSSVEGSKRAPTTNNERLIQSTWAHVLNIESTQIGLDDSFFRLGGDSITAMRASSEMRASRLDISTRHILQEKTISKILRAALSQSSEEDTVMDMKISPGTVFPLSPMQQLYFGFQRNPRMSFDQTVFLKIHRRNGQLSREALLAHLRQLVSTHAMLQARFRIDETGVWEQYLTAEQDSSIYFSHEMDVEDGVVSRAIAHARDSLDITHGPILAATLFGEGDIQKLFISIHHLVVDLVSWRVLLSDLHNLLLGSSIQQPTLSFPTWSSLQSDYIKGLDKSTRTAFTPPKPFLSYWEVDPAQTQHGETTSLTFALNKNTSSALLGRCNDAFQTKPVELLVSALFFSFSRIFRDRRLPAVWSEGHGREPWVDKLDVSQTVGWFTTLFPIEAGSDSQNDIFQFIRTTKDHIRGLSSNGWTFFSSRFSNASAVCEFLSAFPVEIMFNFAGSAEQFERADALFERIPLPEGSSARSAQDYRTFSVFDVFTEVVQGRLNITMSFDSNVSKRAEIMLWVQEFESTLIAMQSQLSARTSEWTLTDFPTVFHNYQDLAEFRDDTLSQLGIKNLDDIEDIFPCSPMQDGMLMTQAKDPNMYRTVNIFRFSTGKGGRPVNLGRLREAWRAVVRQHSLLRAIFVDQFPGKAETMHVILRDPVPEVKMLATIDEHTQGQKEHSKPQLQHSLSIVPQSETEVSLVLEINHAIIDAFSRDILVRDFLAAYRGSLSSERVSYHEFISYVKQQFHDEGLSYWLKYLEGVEPCYFPTTMADETGSHSPIEVENIDSRKLRSFCSSMDITPATLLQAIWALTLGHHTNSTTPCFGVLSSGRDLPVQNVSEIFGPLIRMNVCRVPLNSNMVILETLHALQTDYISSMPHQTVPLASIHNALGLGHSALFNTSISVSRVDGQKQDDQEGLNMRVIGGDDPTEVSEAALTDNQPKYVLY